MPDADSTSCSLCEKPFTSIRRRHHCRFCGFLFCSKCTTSKRSLTDGTIINRSCESCYNALSAPRKPSRHLTRQGTLRDTPRTQMQNEQMKEQENLQEKLKEDETTRIEDNVCGLLQDIKHKEAEFGDFEYDFLETRCLDIMKQLSIPDDKKTILMTLTKKAVETICNSTQYREDLMSLSSYIKFVMIQNSDQSLTDYVNGLILKQQDSKRLESINNPKVLMLQGSNDSQDEINLKPEEKPADYDNNYIRLMIKKIQIMRPNIVLVEKKLHKIAIVELEKLGITIIMNIKPKQLALIARVLQGKVLESVYHTSFLNLYLGTCNEFMSKKIGNDRYMYFLEPKFSSLGCSIVLTDPNKKILKNMKIALKRLIIEYRHISLEKHFFMRANIKPVSNIFLYMHNMNANFIYLTISRNQICRKSNLAGFGFYGIDDQPLGEFLAQINQDIDENCDYGCGNYLKSHVYYFLKNTGRVKISFSKFINSDLNDEIKLTISCLHCKNNEENSIEVDRAIWELSFHKFIGNFLLDQYLTQKRCHHDLYKSHRFIFLLSSVRVSIT